MVLTLIRKLWDSLVWVYTCSGLFVRIRVVSEPWYEEIIIQRKNSKIKVLEPRPSCFKMQRSFVTTGPSGPGNSGDIDFFLCKALVYANTAGTLL